MSITSDLEKALVKFKKKTYFGSILVAVSVCKIIYFVFMPQ